MKRNFLLTLLLTLLPFVGWAQQNEPEPGEAVEGYDGINVTVTPSIYYLTGENLKTAVLGNLQVTGIPGAWFDGDFTPQGPGLAVPLTNEEKALFEDTWFSWNSAGNEWTVVNENQAISEPGLYKVELTSPGEYWVFSEAEDANYAEFEVKALPFQGVALTSGTTTWDKTKVVGTSEETSDENKITVSTANDNLTLWYFSGEPGTEETAPVEVENAEWYIQGEDGWTVLEGEFTFAVGQYKAVRPEDGVTSEYAVTFNVIANPLVEVQVSPTNTQTLFYGTPVEDLKVTPLFFSITEPAFLTDAGRQQIADVLIFKNAEALSTADVGTVKYTLNLNKKSDLYDETTGKLIITKDGTDYNIVPLGMQGDVDILKGKNELVTVDGIPVEDGGIPVITVKKDLKYTAAAQVLVNVPTEGEGAEAKPAKVATLGGVEYFSISAADYQKAFEDAAVAAAQEANGETPLTEEQIAAAKATAITNMPAAGGYDVNAENATVKAEWSSELPTGTEIGNYYVWVRAAGDGSNYDASEPAYIGFAVIDIGTPVIAGTITGVADKYYLKTTRRNWKHLYSTNGNGSDPTFVPGGEFTATIGGVTKDVPASSVSFQVQKATYENGSVKRDENGNIIWETNADGTDKTYPIWSSYGNSFGDFTVGFYRVRVAIDGITNFSARVGGGQSEPYKVFEVVKPTYTVKVTASSTVIPYDNQASVTFSYTVDHTGYAPTFDPAAPDAKDQSKYTWYKGDTEQTPTNGKYAAGEYTVAIKPDLFVATGTDFVAQETEAAQVSIVAGEILAKIEDQELVYGQTLPLYLTFDSGSGIAPTDTRAINEFNSTPRGTGFKATLIKDAEGNAPEATVEMLLTGRVTTNNNLRNTTLLPVGTWKVSGEFGGDETNRILASSATWKVTPKDIANEDFDNPGVEGMRNRELNLHRTYTSNPIELTAADLNSKFTYRSTPLELGKDFEISDYANNVNAGTATFTITGKGNFTGTRENRRFTIDKATIYVRPAADQEWSIGTPVVDENGKSIFTVDWDSPEVVEGEGEEAVVTDRGGIYAQLEYFQQDRKKKKDMAVENGFKALAARIAVPSNVDFYPNGLVAYAENDEEADNYEFEFETGPLTINKGLIKIQLADQETDYAFVEPTITTKKFELVNGDDLNPILKENWDKVIVKDLTKVTLNKVNWDNKKQEVKEDDESFWRYPAGEYGFTATVAEGAFTATNYLIEVVEDHTATLTVNPAEITVNAASPVVSFSEFIKDGRFDQATKDAYIEGITAVNSTNVTIDPVPLGHDKYTDIVASLTVNDDNEIVVALAENGNYTVTNQDAMNGTLTINPLDGIDLTSAPAEYKKDPRYPDELDEDENGNPILIGGDWKKITDRDNMPVDYVTLKLKAATLDPANEAYSQWKAGEWHAMVLPFAITVGDVASQFGYAIINVVDVDATNAATKPNEVHFKLQEIMDEIPANTPFLIKSQFDFDYNTTLKFGNINGALKATYPIIIEANDKPSVDAGKTYTFEGTYEPMVIDKNTPTYKFLGPDNRWKQFNETSVSKYTMQPYTGYVNLQGLTGTREIICFFEEEDGSTTAINAAELQNMMKTEGLYRIDGIKVQGAPTQKGVYIQDGKKFVK